MSRDRRVERRVADVGVVVVLRLLPRRVRRIPDDHANVEPLLAIGPRVVAGEDQRVDHVVGLVHLERVGEHDPRERLVLATRVLALVGGLNVDCGDVVGEQRDLVGVQFRAVFAFERVGTDQPTLEQPGDEGAGPRERVEHMHALV